MSSTVNEFEQLMQRLRSGCPDAARELFERYGKEIQMVVRHRLSRRLRSQFDSLDFAQDAWASFFHIPADRYTFETPEELVSFLSRIASHKVIDAYRHRVGIGEQDHRDAPAQGRHDEEVAGTEPPGRHPTPSQLAIAEEQWDRLLRGQPPEVRRALELLRAGHSHEEVSACLGVHPKMIQRVLQNLNRKLNLS